MVRCVPGETLSVVVPAKDRITLTSVEVSKLMTDRMPTTRVSLMANLRDPALCHRAWREFDEIYRPAIYRYLRRHGLQSASAEDLTQQVFLAAAKKLPEWEASPTRGSLRAWLLTVSRNLLVNELTRRQPVVSLAGPLDPSDMAHSQALNSFQEAIDWEYRRAMFREAAAIVSGQVSSVAWQCFWLTAVEGVAAAQVANRLGISIGLVYTNRCRILHRLQSYVNERQLGEEQQDG